MTLAHAAMKTPTRIVGFNALSESERSRLSSFGVRVDSVIVKLMKTPLRDPVECLVGSHQLLTLDSWLLDRILVELQCP